MIRRRIVFALGLSCLINVWLPPALAQQSAYPTEGRAGIARIVVGYPRTVGTTTLGTPEHGYFRLGNNLGYIRIQLESVARRSGDAVALTDGGERVLFPAWTSNQSSIQYPIEIVYGSGIRQQIPKAMRDRIYVTVTITSRSRWDLQGLSAPQVRTIRFPLGRYEPEGSQAHAPMVIVPSEAMHWVDQIVDLQVEAWVDPSILHQPTAHANQRYRKHLFWARPAVQSPIFTPSQDLPVTLSVRRAPTSVAAPFLLPVGIIGRPPGNQSWSSLGGSSGIGAAVALSTETSTTVTTQSSFGVGPATFWESPTETIRRADGHGITQIMSFEAQRGRRTNNPYGIGSGDVMVALCRPYFEMFKTSSDRDFRLLTDSLSSVRLADGSHSRPRGSPCVNPYYVFPMRELLPGNAPAGQPTAYLSNTERQALIMLNPLLGNPHARLDPRRYVLVRHGETFSGTTLTGDFEVGEITAAEVNHAVARSTETSTSTGFTIPLGAIGTAVGAGFALPDVSHRGTETVTVAAEFRTVANRQHSSDVLLQYEIADSDPEKKLCVEVYYDLFFGAFAFRDSCPAPVQSALREAHRRSQFATRPNNAWSAIHGDQTGVFVVSGSLGPVSTGGGTAMIRSTDGRGLTYRAKVTPGTGNLFIANIRPGNYDIEVEGRRASMAVDRNGVVTVGDFTSQRRAGEPAGRTGLATGISAVNRPPVATLPRAGASPSPVVSIVNTGTGKCVELAAGSPADRANVQQWTCDGSTKQHWTLAQIPAGAQMITNVASGKCLEVVDGSVAEGANVQQSSCRPVPHQHWRINSLPDGGSLIVNERTGKCLEVTGPAIRDGANISQASCRAAPSQRFTVSPGVQRRIRTRGSESPEATREDEGR